MINMGDEGKMAELINSIWDNGIENIHNIEFVQNELETVIAWLDTGKINVANKKGDQWIINHWVQRAILLYLGVLPSTVQDTGSTKCYDKVVSKTEAWDKENFDKHGFRMALGSFIRKGVYIAPKAVIMPSFINIGSHIGSRSMIDIGAAVGSCVHVGDNCHVSANVVLGGVLEPIGAFPTIIEDDVFIGAGSVISEGTVIRKGSVLGQGVSISASTKIIDRASGQIISNKEIPKYAVIVPATAPDVTGQHLLQAALIVRILSPQEKHNARINDLLRY